MQHAVTSTRVSGLPYMTRTLARPAEQATAMLMACTYFAVALSAPLFEQIRVEGSSFVDSLGRVRTFRGVNLVTKLPPYYPPQLDIEGDSFDPNFGFSRHDAALLRSLGFNVVRLGVLWSGVQPSPPPNGVNATYLSVLDQIASLLAEHGIYTLLDAHQDVFSRDFCGEGAPKWAVHTNASTPAFPAPHYAPSDVPTDPSTGEPDLHHCASLDMDYFYRSYGAGEAFQALYDDVDGLQRAFGRFWADVATRFRGHPHVLGYELLNEPWAGDVYRHPELLSNESGLADAVHLQPLYTYLHNAIRAVDNDTILFYEPMDSVDVRLCHLARLHNGPALSRPNSSSKAAPQKLMRSDPR